MENKETKTTRTKGLRQMKIDDILFTIGGIAGFILWLDWFLRKISKLN